MLPWFMTSITLFPLTEKWIPPRAVRFPRQLKYRLCILSSGLGVRVVLGRGQVAN